MERDNVMMRMMTMMMWCRCCCCCCCCCRGCWLIWASASRTSTDSNHARPSAATMHDQIVHRRWTPPSCSAAISRDPDLPAETTQQEHSGCTRTGTMCEHNREKFLRVCGCVCAGLGSYIGKKEGCCLLVHVALLATDLLAMHLQAQFV